MQDLPETPDERLQRRRARRWKRRARIVGPFLGIPLLLGALSLSVDLIEYRPQPTRERLTVRPSRLSPQTVKRSVPRPLRPERPSERPLHPAVHEDETVGENDLQKLDMLLPTDTALRPPTPPQALR